MRRWLLNGASVLSGHVHHPVLRSRSDNPLRSHFQTDVSRYATYARLVSNTPCSVWIEVVAIQLQALQVRVELRGALVWYRVSRAGQRNSGDYRRSQSCSYTSHVSLLGL